MSEIRALAPTTLALALLLAPAGVAAETPWSYRLPSDRERAIVDDAAEFTGLEDSERAALEVDLAQGLLLATATCETRSA